MIEERVATERDVARILREQMDRLSDFMHRDARDAMRKAAELLEGWAGSAHQCAQCDFRHLNPDVVYEHFMAQH